MSVAQIVAGAFHAITMPQEGLRELREEMQNRNEERLQILQSLSRSTSRESRSR